MDFFLLDGGDDDLISQPMFSENCLTSKIKMLCAIASLAFDSDGSVYYIQMSSRRHSSSYVLNCLDRNTTQVRNIKKYLLAALFNAPSTIDSYYAALVNHDLYGGATRRGRNDDELPF